MYHRLLSIIINYGHCVVRRSFRFYLFFFASNGFHPLRFRAPTLIQTFVLCAGADRSVSVSFVSNGFHPLSSRAPTLIQKFVLCAGADRSVSVSFCQ
jgi:hypothetical protein